MSTPPKILAFDVFGTVVDWHGSIVAEMTRLYPQVDGDAFARAWRDGYQPAMARVRSGELGWTRIDELHRLILDGIAADFGLQHLPEHERRQLNRVWHRLNPWPDVVEGLTRLKRRHVLTSLSNGNIGLLTNMAKHGGLPWDCEGRDQLGKLALRLRGLDVPVVDLPRRVVVALVRRLAAFGRRAELLQMDVGDAGLVERSGELPLGKSGAARGGDCAGVDQKIDPGASELVEHGLRPGLLVADGEQRRGFRCLPLFHVSRSINAMAAAGARSLASWMKYTNTSRGFLGAACLSTRGRSSGAPPLAQVAARFAQASRAFGA